MSRPSTPPRELEDGRRTITVKMCCERCGREVGDANTEELEAAMSGAPLPKVAAECKCVEAETAIAVLRVHELTPDVAPLRVSCSCGWRADETPAHDAVERSEAHLVEAIRDALRAVEA